MARTHHLRAILFRIFYSTSFTLVFLALIAFICVSPADALYFSYKRHRLIDIFLISGVYVVTALVAILIYASRLYTTRSVLKEIPKTYVPLDQDELPGGRMWKLVKATVVRSAVLTLLVRPRAMRVELDIVEDEEDESTRVGSVNDREKERNDRKGRVVKLLRPDLRRNEGSGEVEAGFVEDMPRRWGPISHVGWSSPANDDLPDLQYATVVAELMDLIEAKAVSLAPIDPLATPGEDGHPVPDGRVLEALARPNNAGMRAYIARLINLEVLDAGELTTSFLTLYERARFAAGPLSEAEFKTLMKMFADMLKSMRGPDLDLLGVDPSTDDSERSLRQDSDGRSVSSRRSLASSRFSTSGTSSISGSVRHHSLTPRRNSDRSVRVGRGEG